MEKLQDFDSYLRTPIKRGELSQGKKTKQPRNQSINSTSSNLLQHVLTFQLSFINFSTVVLSSNQVYFDSLVHSSLLFSSSSQVSFNSSALFISSFLVQFRNFSNFYSYNLYIFKVLCHSLLGNCQGNQ